MHGIWQLYAMMVLPLLYFLVFKYVPMLGSVWPSDAISRDGAVRNRVGGLDLLRTVLVGPAFLAGLSQYLDPRLLNLVVNFPIPILFAILLNEVHWLPFKKVVQTVSYMPRFISTVVVIAILGSCFHHRAA